MTPTPEQLAKLAEIAGLRVEQKGGTLWTHSGDSNIGFIVWRPHENIAQAWMVVEGMHARGYKFQCGDQHDRGWYAEFAMGWSDKCANQREDVAMPAAICASAIAALETDT